LGSVPGSGHRWQPNHPGEVILWDADTLKPVKTFIGELTGFSAFALAPTTNASPPRPSQAGIDETWAYILKKISQSAGKSPLVSVYCL
jgi:hypothetical protein